MIEPVQMQADISQMPDEQIFTISVRDPINVNFTGHLLKEILNLNYMKKHQNMPTCSSSKQKNKITFINNTGIDVVLSLGLSGGYSDKNTELSVINGNSAILEPLSMELQNAARSQMVSLHCTDRKSLFKLPLVSTKERSIFLYKWPLNSSMNVVNVEPVVELVMQNQRLRSNVADVFGVDRGTDLLSSTTWSPDFNRSEKKSLWQKPYLDGDAPEFSDLTCRLEKTKESITLPNDDWIWANEWEVEIHNGFGVANDADGWEYSADFETFNANRQYYKRGDLCRRRRWTRTRQRVTKTKEIGGSYLVWELRQDENGCATAEARSHLTLINKTALHLTFFAHCALSRSEYFIGCTNPEHQIHVPIQLASANHIRLAIPKMTAVIDDAPELHASDCYLSDPAMIISSGLNSNRILRTAILCDSSIGKNGLSGLKTLHFLLKMRTIEGVTEICIEPALKVINLLPCQIQIQLGESVGRRASFQGKQVVQTEETIVAVGKEVKCSSVNPCLKPRKSDFPRVQNCRLLVIS